MAHHHGVESKTCAACDRPVASREEGDEASWCSEACRRAGVTATDLALERSVLELLAQRAGGATICPSEAARAVGGEDWRPLMEPARAAARRLVAQGEVEVVQGGRVVDPSTAKGPIRLRRPR